MVKPKIHEKEIDKLQKQLDTYDENIKNLTLDRMNETSKQEIEPPKISQKEIEKTGEVYLKPSKWISDGQKFNKDYEKDYEFAKQYVKCIPVHNELRGDRIEMWTHPFGGKGAEFWEIPTDKPVMVPRYVAEQLTKCRYHRMKMEQSITSGTDHAGKYYGSMVVDTTINRLDAHPVNDSKSIFMGAAA